MKEPCFPKNAWYAAAWGHEIEHALAARKICGKGVVLYRKSDGRVAALEDACWHRLLPLSLGRLDGDEVVCGYHGLVFDDAGRCTFMPAQETINPSACVRAFPVVERHRLVWLWMGDPALADPAKVPDFHWNDDPMWVGAGGTFYSLRCDYRLVIDNLMDLTHETYVHAGSIGDDAITKAPFEVTHDDWIVTVTRWMRGIEPPPFWKRNLGLIGKQGPVDRWQIIQFEAPGVIAGDVGVTPAGRIREEGVRGYFLAAITPETERSCHYFWNFVRNFATDDAALTTSIQRAHSCDGKGLYEQDKFILEAQQEAIDCHPRLPFYNLNIDAGALWARKMINHMLAEERLVTRAAE